MPKPTVACAICCAGVRKTRRMAGLDPARQMVPDASVAGLRVTIVGHASVLIQAGGPLVGAYGTRPAHGAVVGLHVAYVGRQRLFRGRHGLWRRAHLPGGAANTVCRPDLALIPIGAYSPRWFMSPQHTDPNEAVQILEDLEAVRAVGDSLGCLPPHQRAAGRAARAGAGSARPPRHCGNPVSCGRAGAKLLTPCVGRTVLVTGAAPAPFLLRFARAMHNSRTGVRR